MLAVNAPRSLVPVTVTVTPASTASVPPLMPSLFASTYTKPDRLAGTSSPKLLFALVWPEASVTAIVSLPVTAPRLPAVSLPSR